MPAATLTVPMPTVTSRRLTMDELASLDNLHGADLAAGRLEMRTAGSGLRMMLQIHYFNMGESVADASGAEICIARTPENTPLRPTNQSALHAEVCGRHPPQPHMHCGST